MAGDSLRTKVFVSYSHKDKRWLDELRPHLGALRRGTGIDIWDDTLIKSGSRWREEINASLAAAKVAVLLVSKNFLDSDFITRVEMPRLIQAAETEGAVVLPLIVSPCRIGNSSALSQLQYINSQSKTLRHMSVVEREETFVRLTDRIDEILAEVPMGASETLVQDVTGGARESGAGTPVSAVLMEALKLQYEACAANKIPLRVFHKLLLVMRIAPDYSSNCLSVVAPDFPAKLEAWLRRQIAKQLETEGGQTTLPVSPDDDPTLASALMIAGEEDAAEADARHFFLALLADDASATMEEIRRTIGSERFTALVQRAKGQQLSKGPVKSVVSDLSL